MTRTTTSYVPSLTLSKLYSPISKKNDQINNEYLEEFQAWLAMLDDDYDAKVVSLVPCLAVEMIKDMFETMMDLATEKEIKKDKEYVLKRGLATLLLIDADWAWYGAMKNQIQQNMAMGTNNYPKSVDETMNILNTFAKTRKATFGKNVDLKLKGQKLISLKAGILAR